jgi:hypothetical protein
MRKYVHIEGMTRSTQPHIHTCVFSPYIISTLYQYLKSHKCEIPKDTFFLCPLLTTLQFREIN